jgi:hypothetical protein
MTGAPARLTNPTSRAITSSTTHATRIRRLDVAKMRYLVCNIHPAVGSHRRESSESPAYRSHAENKLIDTRPTLNAKMSVHETELIFTWNASRFKRC